MKDSSGFLRLRPLVTAAAVDGLMAVTTLGALADGGAFDGGDKVGKQDGYAKYRVVAPSCPVHVGDNVYQYATGDDGNANYATYHGSVWTAWQEYDPQPAKLQ
jgi:hypothetical protein